MAANGEAQPNEMKHLSIRGINTKKYSVSTGEGMRKKEEVTSGAYKLNITDENII